MKAPEKTRLFVLEYRIKTGGLMETIGLGSPMQEPLALWKKDQLERTTHKLGKLTLKPFN